VKIIWDGIHYTEAANKWIFQQIVNGHFWDTSTNRKKENIGNKQVNGSI
jgi:hypothetical protein